MAKSAIIAPYLKTLNLSYNFLALHSMIIVKILAFMVNSIVWPGLKVWRICTFCMAVIKPHTHLRGEAR